MPISLAALVFVLAIAACNGYDPVAQTRAAAKLPANYREMFAAYIKAEKRYTIRDAMITEPYETYGGVLRKTPYATVCVVTFKENPDLLGRLLIPIVEEDWILTIEDGKVDRLSAIKKDPCPNRSPFPEVVG